MLSRIRTYTPEISKVWFVAFGGTDDDILAIGSAGEALIQLKAELKPAREAVSLDILYMIPKEAEETDFVVTQKCVSLTHLVTRDSLVLSLQESSFCVQNVGRQTSAIGTMQPIRCTSPGCGYACC